MKNTTPEPATLKPTTVILTPESVQRLKDYRYITTGNITQNQAINDAIALLPTKPN